MNSVSYVNIKGNSLKVKDISIFIISILLGKVTFIGGSIPYSIAFWQSATGYSKTISIMTCIGLMIGNTISKGLYGGLEFIAIISLLSIFNLIFQSFELKDKKYEYIKIFSSIFIIKLILIIFQGFLLYDFTFAILTSLISTAMFIIFDRGVNILLSTNRTEKVDFKQTMSLGLIASFAIAGLGTGHILGFNLMNITGIFITLLVARTIGIQGSIIAGTLIGAISVIANDLNLNIIVSYTLGGLLAGILAEKGNIASIFGFIIANTVITYFNNSGIEMLIQLRDIITAGLILFIVPQKYFKVSKDLGEYNLFGLKTINNKQLQLAGGVSNKLKKVSSAISELSTEFIPISKSNKALTKEDTNKFIDKIVQKVCKTCDNCHICYGSEFADTYDNMTKLINLTDKKGKITKRDVNDKLEKGDMCTKIDELTENINNTYEIYRVNMVWRKKMGENRKLIADQLKNVSTAVGKIAVEIDTNIKYKDSLELKLLYELESRGAKIDELVINNNKNDIEITLYSKDCIGMKNCKTDLENTISNIVQRRMTRVGMICPQATKGRCMQKFISKELYKPDIGISTINKENEKISGDAQTVVELENGKVAGILSDGMGFGEDAAKNSKKVIQLLEKFLKSGFDKDTAINIVNSSFILNSLDETYSTIDMAILDLFSGRAEFAKYGACPTYIKTNNDVKIIKAITLPAGLFGNIEFELSSIDINEGEYIIIVSDGIIDSNRKEDWLYELIKKIDPYDAQEIADIIIGQAIRNYNDIAEDDMTVLVIGIKPNESLVSKTNN